MDKAQVDKVIEILDKLAEVVTDLRWRLDESEESLRLMSLRLQTLERDTEHPRRDEKDAISMAVNMCTSTDDAMRAMDERVALIELCLPPQIAQRKDLFAEAAKKRKLGE